MNATPPRSRSSLPSCHFAHFVVWGASLSLLAPVAFAQQDPARIVGDPARITYEWNLQGPVSTTRPQTPDESKAHKSLDVGALSPLAGQLEKLGIYSGFYDFDEGVEDNVVSVKRRDEVSFANQAYFQREYHTDPDLRRENGFVGFWASFPLRSRGEHDSENLERLRTRRELPSDAASSSGSLPGTALTPEQPSKPIKAFFQIPQLFKPKPQSNLIPTSGPQIGTGSTTPVPSASTSTSTSTSLAMAEPVVPSTSLVGSVPSPPEETSALSPVEPPPQRKGRLLGIIPLGAAPETPSPTAGERRPRLVEQIFGKPSAPTRRAPSRPAAWFHR